MLSRTANSIYWMSRYLERADNIAQFIKINIRLMMEMELKREVGQWQSLIKASGDESLYWQYYSNDDEDSVIKFLTFDENNPNSIISCIEKARENARTVREIIPFELWETLNKLYLLVKKYQRKRHIENLQSFYEQIKDSCWISAGLSEDAMSHDESWHFSRLGRLIERADKTTRILDVKYFLLLPSVEDVDSPYDDVEWASVLNSTHGLQMYRRQFHRIDYRHVTKFLIFDTFFPHSVTYCVNSAMQSLDNIIQMLSITVPATQEIIKLSRYLDNITIQQIINDGLHQFLDRIQLALNKIDQAIYQSFFAMDEKLIIDHQRDSFTALNQNQ